jgi:hypothetical protein
VPRRSQGAKAGKVGLHRNTGGAVWLVCDGKGASGCDPYNYTKRGGQVMQYKIAREPTVGLLEASVKFYFLSEGWELQGGVSYDGSCYTQAVVLKRINT